MPRFMIGLLSLCLLLLMTGCAASEIRTVPIMVTPTVPHHLTAPLEPPGVSMINHRDLLALIADYEKLRRRANADRAAVEVILASDAGTDE
ncbi:hypothetical protein [Halomonas korlensis]|uniref:Uncharacterized protein n=1 Tax=Halomonas korlensis TaxID=463301 RepID=A0A1I7JMK9_9GAMM|nr:hypothetical protein [Halomonas korlensis]SFU86401.1 hypothetical protein SAMN04487955_11178 [Halomonas korlensis]